MASVSWRGPGTAPLILVIALFLLFLFRLISHRGAPAQSVVPVAFGLLGIVYIPLLFSYMMLIRSLENGQWLLLLLFSIVWGNDTFAYYTGRAIGRHKLAPAISPNKTIEGAIGGLAGGILVSFALHRFILSGVIGTADTILIALIMGILGQLGDLIESSLKRSVGAKDSGFVVPGHGGILDRIDSIILPLPFLYYYIKLMDTGIWRI